MSFLNLVFDPAQIINIAIAVVLASFVTSFFARRAARQSEQQMTQIAGAFATIANYLHQAIRDRNFVGVLNLTEIGFPKGFDHILQIDDSAHAHSAVGDVLVATEDGDSDGD